MRILYFSKGYTTHDRRFLAEFAAHKQDVSFVCLDGWKGRRPEGLPPRVKAFRLTRSPVTSPSDCPVLVPAFRRIVNQLRPDIVHAGPVPLNGFLAALAGGAPLAAMSWGSDLLKDADRDPFWNSASRYALEKSARFVCDSDAVRSKAQKILPYPGRRIIQFPWGVDLDQFRPVAGPSSLRLRLGWENNFVLISTRSWEPIYGIETLLKGFRRVHAENKNVRLLLLGDGSQRRENRSYIRRNKLSPACYLPGLVPEETITDYFHAADLYVAGSHSDGTSVSLLQAMACGLPVLVTDIPGNREWVKPGVNGELFPVDDDSSLAKKALRAMALDGDQRARISAVNRRMVERRADWHANFKLLLKSFYDLCGGPR